MQTHTRKISQQKQSSMHFDQLDPSYYLARLSLESCSPQRQAHYLRKSHNQLQMILSGWSGRDYSDRQERNRPTRYAKQQQNKINSPCLKSSQINSDRWDLRSQELPFLPLIHSDQKQQQPNTFNSKRENSKEKTSKRKSVQRTTLSLNISTKIFPIKRYCKGSLQTIDASVSENRRGLRASNCRALRLNDQLQYHNHSATRYATIVHSPFKRQFLILQHLIQEERLQGVQ